jgi:hypothetical protein
MRRTKRIAAALCLAALPVAGAHVATAAEPGCNRWDLEIQCTTNPSRVIVSDPFQASVTVRNTGDAVLTRVAVSLRGDLGAKGVQGTVAPVQKVFDKLEPGETQELSGTFASDVVGTTRIIATAGDETGWAKAGCACTVEVLGLPAIQSEMTDKDQKRGEKGIFVVGESFLYVLTVENDVGSTVTPDLKVVFSLPKELEFVAGTGDNGVTVTGSGQSATSTAFVLAPNRKQAFELVVKAIAAPASNLVQTRASIQTVGGIEVAEETESTTLKN